MEVLKSWNRPLSIEEVLNAGVDKDLAFRILDEARVIAPLVLLLGSLLHLVPLKTPPRIEMYYCNSFYLLEWETLLFLAIILYILAL